MCVCSFTHWRTRGQIHDVMLTQNTHINTPALTGHKNCNHCQRMPPPFLELLRAQLDTEVALRQERTPPVVLDPLGALPDDLEDVGQRVEAAAVLTRESEWGGTWQAAGPRGLAMAVPLPLCGGRVSRHSPGEGLCPTPPPTCGLEQGTRGDNGGRATQGGSMRKQPDWIWPTPGVPECPGVPGRQAPPHLPRVVCLIGEGMTVFRPSGTFGAGVALTGAEAILAACPRQPRGGVNHSTRHVFAWPCVWTWLDCRSAHLQTAPLLSVQVSGEGKKSFGVRIRKQSGQMQQPTRADATWVQMYSGIK